MFKKKTFKTAGVILTLILITGCGYSYHPRIDYTAMPDSTDVFVVNGKSYRCVNKDGTWKCESIADAQARAENSVFNTRHLDAKNPNPSKGNK